tara:strand:+ start:321 stop:1520 length:1200 start_codon:yes stop_codon:yes gene_type:complete
MKALDQLENRLLEHWQRKESRKTWQEWFKWLEQIQCPLRVDRPEQVSPVAQINYQTFLHFCETALARLPDWESKLTTPNWVEAHNLCLLLTDWTSSNVTTTKSTTGQPEQHKYLTEDDLAGTHQALLRLAEEVDKVKGRLEQIEQQSIQQLMRVPMPSPPLPGGSPLKQPPPQVSPSSPSTPMMSQTLENELRFRAPPELKPKTYVPESFDEDTAFPARPLDEAYLSFNEWCDHLYSIGLNIQELSSENLRVESSRPISFLQFSHRLERRVTSSDRLHDLLETFRLHYRTGFSLEPPTTKMPGLIPELPEIEEDKAFELTKDINSTSTGFQLPPEDLYQDYNSWLEWLIDQNFDPRIHSSQDLQVESSHRISFPQFRRRLERKLDNPETFRNLLGLSEL